MSDTGQDIIIEDQMTLNDLRSMVEDTEGRLAILEISGSSAHILYRNFSKKSGRRYRDKYGAWELEPLIDTWVQLI